MAGGAGLGGSMTVVGVLLVQSCLCLIRVHAALDHEDLLASRPNFFSAALLGWVFGFEGLLGWPFADVGNVSWVVCRESVFRGDVGASPVGGFSRTVVLSSTFSSFRLFFFLCCYHTLCFILTLLVGVS